MHKVQITNIALENSYIG